jgi:diguanylate cyclase (GGDEF)-like protein/PAS domain S-box-containing protein
MKRSGDVTPYRDRRNGAKDFAALLHALPDTIFQLDYEGRIVSLFSEGSDSECCFNGKEPLQRKLPEVFPDAIADRMKIAHFNALREGKLQSFRYLLTRQNRECRFEARIIPMDRNGASHHSSLVIVRNIGSEKLSGDYLDIVKKIFEASGEGMILFDLQRGQSFCNDLFREILGLRKDEKPAKIPEDLREFFEPHQFRTIERALEQKGHYRGEISLRRKGGGSRRVRFNLDTVTDGGKPLYRIGTVSELTRLQGSDETLHFSATHDSLTGLPNRRKLLSDLEEVLRRTSSQNRYGAVFFIDLDNFKFVNDTMGHAAGDKVLIECASRIGSVIREHDIFGRLGGDEFLLITQELKSPRDLTSLAQKIITVLNRPIAIGEYKHTIGVSIGVSIFPGDSRDMEQLLQYADMAMYQAKKQGKNRYQFYSGNLDKAIKRRFMIEKVLHHALEYEKLFIVFQPKTDLRTNVLTGFEVLMRVDERIAGPMDPAEFVPVAEESDLILQIGRWVFARCCQTLFQWRRDLEIDHFGFSVNLSRRQLMDDTLVDFTRTTLEKYRIDPGMIEFEITETAFISSQERAAQTIRRLKDLGCKVSIDNFGTGYSSLMTLKNFPVDKLKIDRSFIKNISSSSIDRSIVKAAVAMAHAMGLRTVAVGVDNEAQKKVIQLMGFGEVQGDLYGEPKTATETYRLLQRQCKRRGVR